jgi:phage baseplate assembly protein W|tara:strand:- start:719 stop:1144 length:426 start_codon:yes stop_codon:yes gene_type:complete
MSTFDIDNNDDFYIGVQFPLSYGGTYGFFNRSKTLFEQVKSNIRNLILTNLGERIFQPELGSNVQSIIFENITNDLISDVRDKVEEAVREAISQWLPYVILNEVNVFQDENNPNKVFLQIEYSISIDPNSLDQITFTFNGG